MEQRFFPRRSASHGALRSTYSSHGGGAVPSPVRPFHKPLRSVNENSVLLHSPGALESMLKTTTETGDIGIFTIKPIPPSPLRSRDTISEIGHPRPRPHRSVEDVYRQNLTMRPPSHRDAISEVVSVYGSDSLKSGTATLSPNSTEGLGQRSYSMTTCGSRHLSNYKSTNTLQSQASGSSHLQRPRSPFPYPTRLKRPGVRPVSPAVTENGQIDYSRMVEINRVSYRTVHGHFKHAYSPMSRLPHPLGLREDINRSTPSLAPPGPPPNFCGPPPPPFGRTHSPASVSFWNSTFHGRLDSTPTRASSLTSVPNMYRRMPPTLRVAKSYSAEPPPRYYDYTEEFESKSAQMIPLTQVLVPPPTRTVRCRPLMLRDNDDHLSTGHLAAVFGEGDSAFYDCESQIVGGQEVLPALTTIPDRSRDHAEMSHRPASHRRQDSTHSHNIVEPDASEVGSRNTRSSDIDLLPSQIGRDSIDTFNPSLDVELRDVPSSYKYVAYRANTAPKTKTKSPERHVQVLGGRTLTIRSEQGVILRDDASHEIIGRETPESCQSHVEIEEDEAQSPNQPNGPLLNSDLASQEFHETSSVLSKAEPSAAAPDRVKGPALTTQSDPPKPQGLVGSSTGGTIRTLDKVVGNEASQNSENEKPEANRCHRGHRRNHAVLGISTTNLPREDNEGHPHIPPMYSTVQVVSPKPISPARQLKLKNSIPQLMKTLPPVPGGLGYDLPPAPTDVLEEDELQEILVPFPDEPLRLDQQAVAYLGPMIDSGVASNPQIDVPKFRLKIKTNSCSEISHRNENMPQQKHLLDAAAGKDIYGNETRSRHQNKLKVRSPRRSRPSSSHCATIRHTPDAKTPGIVADLMRQRRQDLFSIPPKSETMLLRKRRKPSHRLICPRADNTGASDPVLVDRAVISVTSRVHSTTSTDNNELPAIDKDTLISSIPPRGLIKRMSNLRALLSPSTISLSRVRDSGSLGTRKATAGALSHTDLENRNPSDMMENQVNGIGQPRLGQRIQLRLSGWVRGAKTAMRRCAHKKNNRNEKE